jgi:hypothetical protein
MMCEINPKQTKILRLEFFTSAPLTKKEFEDIVAEHCMYAEMTINQDMRIRCHVHEVLSTHNREDV